MKKTKYSKKKVKDNCVNTANVIRRLLILSALTLVISLSLGACGQKPAVITDNENVNQNLSGNENTDVNENGNATENENTNTDKNTSENKNQNTASRPLEKSLTISLEGEPEEVPATLYTGEGWSLYIPDEEWNHETAEPTGKEATSDIWTSQINETVRLKVLSYTNTDAAAAKEIFAAGCGYQFEDLMGGETGDDLTGTDKSGNRISFWTVDGSDGSSYAVAWEYPEDAAEGFGSSLEQMAQTFICEDN